MREPEREAESVVSSASLCEECLAVYDALFDRCVDFDPDGGIGEAFVCGRASIAHRGRGETWTLGPAAVEQARHLFRSAELATGDDLIAEIELMPPRFLALLERRRRNLPSAPRRRFRDNWSARAAARPRPSPEGFHDARRTSRGVPEEEDCVSAAPVSGGRRYR